MKRDEARRILEEASARTLWQAGGEALTIPAVDKIIARKQAARAWVKGRTDVLFALVLALPLGFLVAGFFAPLDIPAGGRAFLGFLFWVVGCFTIITIYPTSQDKDLAFARRLRIDLAQEGEKVARLRARIAADEPFALYLRTFSAETSAMTARDVADQADQLRSSNILDPADPATRRLAAHYDRLIDKTIAGLKDDWTLKRRAIAAVAKVLPVVCLGNIDLQDEKRADLAALKVEDATLVRTDWWPVFQELEGASVITFVVLDQLTTHITSELTHLMARGRPFLVICAPETDRRLLGVDGYQALIDHPATVLVILNEDNLGLLEKALQEAMLPPPA